MRRTYGRDRSVGVGRIDNLVVYLEREIPDESPHLEWLEDALTDAVKAHGARAAHLHVVEVAGRGGGLREGPRERLTRMARAYDGRLGAAAFVVPRAGFLASVVRSVITGVLLVVRPRTPTRSFERLPNALSWLRECCDDVPSLDTVDELLASLHEH